MEQIGDLKLDEMEFDCQLALKFLEENISNLSVYPPPDDEKLEEATNRPLVKNNCGINVFYSNKDEHYQSMLARKSEYKKILPENKKLLKNKIKENAELFAQLEWLMRKIPKEEVKKQDITLMVQQLDYFENAPCFDQHIADYLVIADHTPLALLALVADQPYTDLTIIEATPNTAPVCYLFAKLCHEAGFTGVSMGVFAELIHIDDLELGCTAVITNKADVDSATDVILHSTVKYPWKIRNILVQEDTYEAVEKALQWKSDLKNGPEISGDIKKMCKKVFSYEDKIILVEYAGSDDALNSYPVILLQTYKTANDLRTFKTSFCISLWSNDINEANLIANASSAELIWINDYGTFDGPLHVSRTVMRSIERQYYSRSISYDTHLIKDLSKMLPNWLKLDFNARLDIVFELMKEHLSDVELQHFLEECRDAAPRVSAVENGKIYTKCTEGSLIARQSLMKALVDLVNGNMVFADSVHLKNKGLKALINKQCPIMIGCYRFSDCFSKSKVIIQNCGTQC